MRIGINTRFLLAKKMEGFGWYTYEVVKRIVENHPEHEFVFFFDRKCDQRFIFAKNVEPVVLFPPTRAVALIISWFHYRLFFQLKRRKIDLFFSPDGFLSLYSKCPQVGVIHDLNFIHHPKDLPYRFRWFYRRYFPKYARKASHLLTVSEFSKQDIVDSYQIPADKITVAWNGASEQFVPLETSEQQKIRSKYTKGEDYFLFVGALSPRKNLKTLLAAFQRFREQGNQGKLLIVGENLFLEGKRKKFLLPDEWATDVHFTGHLRQEELTKVMASALALVFIPYFEGFGIPMVEAMKCGTPVIAGNLTSLPEVVGDAGILVNPFAVEEVATAMKKMVDEPKLREELRQKGLERSKLFNWDFTADKVWQVLENELSKLR